MLHNLNVLPSQSSCLGKVVDRVGGQGNSKKIGILQENFHSEVVDFLLELHDGEVILYNDIDKYDNKSLYKNKYPNLQIKELESFIPDLTNKICNKMIIVSWDNIMWLNLLLHYKDDLLFIAHSNDHIQKYNKYNLNYFSLTPLLNNYCYMLPINNTNKTQYTVLKSQNKIKPVNFPIEYINSFNNHIKDTGSIPMMIIGYFLNENKNIALIEELLQTRNIVLFICVPELSEVLINLSKKYLNLIYIAICLSTPEILYCIDTFNINNLLFAPSKNSDFFNSQWSGSIAFAFNNHLNLIIPEQIAKIYNIQDFTLTYNIDDVNINKLVFDINNYADVNNATQLFRNNIYNRNKYGISFFENESKLFNYLFPRLKTNSTILNINFFPGLKSFL
jgi:hypothetical protein